MQFIFIHSGVDGGQPQGSYFVVLKKDGVRLPVPDSVRSQAKTRSSGQLGDWNYEFSLGTGDLPGNNVAGNYTIWVHRFWVRGRCLPSPTTTRRPPRFWSF